VQLRQNSSDAKVDRANYGQQIQQQITSKVSNATEVVSLHDLDPGRYLVVACTWKPGINIKFLLRIFTDTDICPRCETITC